MEQSRRSSQFIAYVLRLVNVPLLAPGIPAVCMGLWMTLFFKPPGMPIDPAAVERQRLVNAALIAGMFLAGCVLLWGYDRHARGKAVLGGSLLLWLLTIVYNAGLIVWLWPVESLNPPNLITGGLLLWQLTVIVLALLAIGFDLRQRSRANAAPSWRGRQQTA